mmetsp:Transcript_71597/g.209856  ORF Transcript_71597/g.209856 Transcript_71597/m.209856 type:complete len:330 (-) Transcript_71597:201-1190(-)
MASMVSAFFQKAFMGHGIDETSPAPEAATRRGMGDCLKEGLAIYQGLKGDMDKMLGIQQYAEHMRNIVSTMKEVNKYLDEHEKQAYEKLVKAEALAEAAMTKASVVISTIKAQSRGLAAVLDAPGADAERLRDACKCFAGFAKEIQPLVAEAEERLDEALSTLGHARQTVMCVLNSLKRVQASFVQECQEAKAKQRALAYGGAAVGVVLGPLGWTISFTAAAVAAGAGLATSYGVAGGICEGLNVPRIEEDFRNQRDIMKGYIEDFEDMGRSVDQLKCGLKQRKEQLLEVHGQLSAAGTLAGVAGAAASPRSMLGAVRSQARELAEACG